MMKSEIPAQSLINNYFTADYSDAYACAISKESQLTPDDIMVSFWTDFPVRVNTLFSICIFLARLVGRLGLLTNINAVF